MVQGYNASHFYNLFRRSVVIVLHLIRLFSLLFLVLLQSCQQNAEFKSQQAALIQKKSDAASYNMQLGMAYLKQGDRSRAKRKLLTALELAPHSADTNVAMAYYLEQAGDVQEARIYYQKALSLAPKSGAQLNNFGTFLCRLGRYKEADDYFLNAVKDIQYVHTAAAYENAGLCAEAIPDYTKAKNYFIKALKQDPQRRQALYELVAIELKQNHPKEALVYLQTYPELSLHDPSLLAMTRDATQRAGISAVETDPT